MPTSIQSERINRGLGTCIACHSEVLEKVEQVSIAALSDAWARGKSFGDSVTQETIYQFLLSDLESSQVEIWQCADCGLEVSVPMRSWAAEHYPTEPHSLGFDHQVALEMLTAISPARILDIGCADGQFLELAAALGHDVSGVDFAAEDIQVAKARGFKAELADVDQLASTFRGQPKFQIVTLFQIIEHLNQPDDFFEQLGEIAEREATLIVGCPSSLRYTRVVRHAQRVELSDFWDYPPQHTLRWTSHALKSFLLRHGWQVDLVTYEPFKLFDAAAHLAGIDALASGNGSSTGRRLNVLKWMIKLSGAKFFSNTTGVRLVVRARRVADVTGPDTRV